MAVELESWSMQETMLMFAPNPFFQSSGVPDLIGGEKNVAHYLDEHVKSN